MMEPASVSMTSLMQELIQVENERGRFDRAEQLEESALASAWFQPEYGERPY